MNLPSLRASILDLLAEAYEDAGFRGLCDEGRWEAAIGAVRAADPALILQRAAATANRNPARGDDVMAEEWKPTGYSQVSPYLIVSDAARTIEFLVRAFDAGKLRHFPAEDGRVIHAEVRIGDSVIMIADANEGWPPVGAHVHVYVADVDETYRRALEAGAESVQEPVRKEDEDRRGGVKDPGGTTWWIATRQG